MDTKHLFRGPLALLTAAVMARQNREAEEEAVLTLDPRAHHAVVAIGVGPGVGVELLLPRVRRVVAVDPSPSMAAATVRRNQRAVEAGQLEVAITDAASLPMPDGTADGAIAVNNMQLWEPLAPSLAEVARVLRPGARLIAFTHDWAIERSTGQAPERWITEVAAIAGPAGFGGVDSWRGRAEQGRSVALSLAKAEA